LNVTHYPNGNLSGPPKAFALGYGRSSNGSLTRDWVSTSPADGITTALWSNLRFGSEPLGVTHANAQVTVNTLVESGLLARIVHAARPRVGPATESLDAMERFASRSCGFAAGRFRPVAERPSGQPRVVSEWSAQVV
jgi:hypothetical protein